MLSCKSLPFFKTPVRSNVGSFSSRGVPAPKTVLASPKYYSRDFVEKFHLSFHGIFIGHCTWLQEPEKEYCLNYNEENLLKDSESTRIRIGPSFITNNSGLGGFFTSNLEGNEKVCDYPGRLAVVIVEKGHQATVDQYWGMHTRAVRFQCQPIKVADLYVRLEIVGSMNSAATYFNTLFSDSIISTDYPHYARLAEELDFVTRVESLFNLAFREKASAGYDTNAKSFTSFAHFVEWLGSCPVEIWTTRAVLSGEEGYIPYTKKEHD